MKTPIGPKDAEDLLPLVFSMLQYTSADISQIKEARAKIVHDEPAAKKGGWGLFGGAKKK